VTLIVISFCSVHAPYIPFFFTTTSPPLLPTPSLHDALPIFCQCPKSRRYRIRRKCHCIRVFKIRCRVDHPFDDILLPLREDFSRSEEHTSELQSRFDIVCRLLLEKKK